MPGFVNEWKREPLARVIARRLREWWVRFDRPDPWSAEEAEAVLDPDCLPVCHRCFLPQDHTRWFCPACGTAVGPYNNVLPYIRIFSLGEVLRSGLGPDARFTGLTVPGYVLVGLNNFWILSPLYYGRLLWNGCKRRRSSSRAPSGGEGEHGASA